MGFKYEYDEKEYISKEKALTLFKALGLGQSEQVLRRVARQGVFKTLDIHPKFKESPLGTGMIFEKESYYTFLIKKFQLEERADREKESTRLIESMKSKVLKGWSVGQVDLLELRGDFEIGELDFDLSGYGLELARVDSDFYKKRKKLKKKRDEKISEIVEFSKGVPLKLERKEELKKELTEITTKLTRDLITEKKKNKSLLKTLHKDKRIPNILLKRTELHFERIIEFYTDEFYEASFNMLEHILNYVFAFEFELYKKYEGSRLFAELIRFDTLLEDLLFEVKVSRKDVYDKHSVKGDFDLREFLVESNERKVWKTEF